MTEQQREAIDYIMDSFDFDKVQTVMEFLKWEWRDEGVPDRYSIKKEVRRLLRDAIENKSDIAIGGFIVKYYPPNNDGGEWIELAFELESWDIEIK